MDINKNTLLKWDPTDPIFHDCKDMFHRWLLFLFVQYCMMYIEEQ